MSKRKKIILPCLRGKIGDWRYYVTLLKFKDIAERVSMVPEIHKSVGLSNLIQREITNRSTGIVEYLKTQDQRFFNSLILGVYGGHPKWHELSIEESIIEGLEGDNIENVGLSEEDIENLSSSLGVLILTGGEKIFAIDGQHRTKAIKDAVKQKPELKFEEVPTIFVAHKKTLEGEVRTRRLFSTLNRYAKPVNKSEIIAIDEEDNGAIITRNLVENFELLQDKISFAKTRAISLSNKTSFTNIIVLYDFIVTILTNKKVFGFAVTGKDYKNFTHRRATDEENDFHQELIKKIFVKMFEEIPVLKKYLVKGEIDRRNQGTSLLFRPVGQNVLYSVIKASLEKNKLDEAINFFATNDFSLRNPVWKRVFTDPETGNMKTDKTIQKYAFQLILRNLGISLKLSEKEKEMHKNFKIDPTTFEITE